MSQRDEAFARIRTWRENPVRFVRELFGVEPDVWQVELLEAFASQDEARRRIALQACAGPGKTACLAWCAWNFLACYGARGEHPKGAAVSITSDNLRDNLWPELAKWRDRSPFLQATFEWTKERVFAKDYPSTWFLSARTFAKSASAEEQGRTLSGLHSQYILYLIDESGDISTSVLRAAEQGLGNTTFGKILQAGNPTSHDGMLYAAATSLRHLWHVISITGDPDDPRRSKRIPINWAREQIATHGRDNPWVMAYILGQFPPASLNALIGPDECSQAMRRALKSDVYGGAAKILGVDVAGDGADRTVIMPRQGLAAFRPVIMRGAKTSEIAGRVAQAATKWGADGIMVDNTGGYGAGVVDTLMLAGYPVFPVQFAGKPFDGRYLNKRAEMYFEACEWIKHGGALPNLPELQGELCAHTYLFKSDRFQIVGKDQVKEVLGRSPDLADALALTFAFPVAPKPTHPALVQRHHAATEYDPIAYGRDRQPDAYDYNPLH